MANLQVKNFPDELHATLRKRAKTERVTVSAYVTAQLRRAVARPTIDEWLAETERVLPPAALPSIDAAAAVREARDEYDPDSRFPAP